MESEEQDDVPAATSPELAAEESRLRRRRSSMGGRSCRSVGGRLSLAAPPHPAIQDQVLQVDESQPWDVKLSHLLDIGLREAIRRLESKLPGDECVPELRAALVTQSEFIAEDLSKRVCHLSPAATGDASQGEHFVPRSATVDMYKEKTRELEKEYRMWKILRKQRQADCRTAEMEFEEAKSLITTVDESEEMNLSPEQRSFLESWTDCSKYIEEAQLAKEKSQLILQEVKITTKVVKGLLTASGLQAENTYIALENLSNGQLKSTPLNQLLSGFLNQHLSSQTSGHELQM